ncbi:MAG TPA: LamG-like jellyroll fold domain-containing protein, partial [Thermoanaerobaculia bacterium]|nr:LamG-like jellyroll fold domain-containing protein [Thermoanaerobaculia bacterium]
ASDAADLGNMANFSFDAWVQFRTVPTGRLQFVMLKGLAAGAGTNSYALWLNTAGTMSAAVESATQLSIASGTDRITAGRPYHMAVTYDGAQIRLYINGALQGSAALTGLVRDTSSPFFLGRREGAGTDGGGDSIDGTIDEARIWSRALSEAEVRAAYEAGCIDGAPPVAVAGADQTIECAGAATTVTLDGSASSDPDGDVLSYEWFEGTTLVATGDIAEAMLPAGDHTIRLRVTDPSGLWSEDTLTVVIADTARPVISAPDGVSATTGAGGTSCAAFISDTILGKASASDVCFGDVEVERSGVPAGNLFPIGTTTITYTARDAAGNEATADQIVTVSDSTPASFSNVSVTPARLWPPNQKMVDVFVGYHAAYGCGVATASLSVTSSDAAGAKGDVTSPDWIIVDGHHVQLRAERAPGARERIYTITITARDADGNESSRSVEVSVSPPSR